MAAAPGKDAFVQEIADAVLAESNEIEVVFVPCENAEDMLIDGIKFLLEIAARQHREAA